MCVPRTSRCRSGPRRRPSPISTSRSSLRRRRARRARRCTPGTGSSRSARRSRRRWRPRPSSSSDRRRPRSAPWATRPKRGVACSKRRHQKLIEEAPSVAVTPALRRRMSDAATAAAGAVGYLGAGTIEFLLAPSGEFSFLEMNTRLQVEHPVTELVYGVDIVREQLRIAAGKPMRVHAGTLHPRGHALECRITAEDPFNDFLPATGILRYLRAPSGPGVRWDGGGEQGNDVTQFYAPRLPKLIVWGDT